MKPKTSHILEQNGISVSLTEHILRVSENGRRLADPIRMEGLPKANDPAIINVAGTETELLVSRERWKTVCADLGIKNNQLGDFALACGFDEDTAGGLGPLRFDHGILARFGLLLVPMVSFGVLNGGSATSYFDSKKNQELSPFLYTQFSEIISSCAERYGSVPKGLGPAYLQPTAEGYDGPSFVVLKLRAWLVLIAAYQNAAGKLSFALPWQGLEKKLPVFQMVSVATRDALKIGFEAARTDPLLSSLIAQTGVDPCSPATGVQEMIAAFTAPASDGTRDVFLSAWGTKNRPLALPGGHGQNFQVLAPIYRQMHAAGKRFAYLGNIDNIGSIPDSVGIALTCLRETEASFEFAFKTPLDRKGGVLVRNTEARLTCGDIGPAVSPQAIKDAEAQNLPILFNCATGLFKLDSLCANLDTIIATLPIRFSTQNKDAGMYSQAEQVTWEVIGLLNNPLILGVSKQRRFLAAKFFLDCILTSGLAQGLTSESENDQELLQLGAYLHDGLQQLLREKYGMKLQNAVWIAKN